MELIQQHVDNNQNVEGEYLTYLLSNTQMSIKDVYGSVSELLLAGVDTVNVHWNSFAFRSNEPRLCCLFTEFTPPPQTSNTLTWTLHLLSKYPQCQEILFKEVSTSVPADRAPSAEEVTRMPYLRAVVKESLRWGHSSAQTASKHPTNTQTYLHQCRVFVLLSFTYDAGCFQWFLWMDESWQIKMWWLVDISFQRMWVWFIHFCLVLTCELAQLYFNYSD